MLAKIYKVWVLPLVWVAMIAATAVAQESPNFPIEPVWEKINGQWNFNKNNKNSHQILLHITTTIHNNKNKNLLIKELVKLPFIVYLPQTPKGATPLDQ
jgi:hypothetical protein